MTLRYQDTIETRFAAVAGVSGRRSREEADDYPVIARVGNRHRVIECRDRIQWIVQRLIGKRWRGISFHRDRAALIRRCVAVGTVPANLKTLRPFHMGGADH